ncbi:hypothetical protein [Microcoleus sp. PH2017_02_FOX_O_A]|uniref:hypothetical protein n=1 Tax=Microcoleus sp. PH2017_02_FOX_O_A TaxID=2798813 RepID=UPI0025CEE10F|nr:hypothetical protein [Microcoleus sp. PH2017_02_FOX_O_A]
MSAKLQLQPRARSPCFSCIRWHSNPHCIEPEGQGESGFTSATLRSGASTVPSSGENVKIKI